MGKVLNKQQLSEELAELKKKCCCKSFGTTEGEPTEPPVNGISVLFDTSTGIMYYWDGDSWESFSTGGIMGTTELSPPVDAPVGDEPVVLINLTTGVLYYWNGSSWLVGNDGGTDTNFANSDLTLTDDRTHDGDGNAISFLNFLSYLLTSVSGDQNSYIEQHPDEITIGTVDDFDGKQSYIDVQKNVVTLYTQNGLYQLGASGEADTLPPLSDVIPDFGLGYDSITHSIYRITKPPTSDTNFANTDLTFTANRQHDLVSKLLKIIGQVGSSFDIEITGPSGTHYLHVDEDDVTLRAVQSATQYTILDINVLDALLEARNNALRHGVEVLPTYVRLMSGASGADGEVRAAAAAVYLYNALNVYKFAKGDGTLALPTLDDSTPDYGLGVNSADGRVYRISKPVSDAVYGAGWDAVTNVAPSKNAVYDKIEALAATIPTVSDTAYAGSWNGVTTVAPSKNAVYDQMELKANTSDLANTKADHIGITIDGAGSVITTGQKGMIRVPYGGTITGWTILETSDTPITGSIVIDVWKDTYANYPPDASDSIMSTKPTLSSAVKNQNLAPTFIGAGATVTAGDVLGFNVEATPSNVKRVTLSVHITRT